jgi:hypothetical protein
MSGDQHDETFAEVLNGLTLGRARRRSPTPPSSTVDDPGPAWPESDPPAVLEHELSCPDREDPAAQGPAAIVRPYSWTRGRTRSTVDFRIEALVTTSERGDDIEAMTQVEHRSVAELCREPRSVAELATLLDVPLGVAKVLVGDMAGLGLVIVHKTATGGANKAHLMLMERVLSGLRRL